MAAKLIVTKSAETPSERFERIMRRVMARNRRSEERRILASRHDRSIASRINNLNRLRSAKKLG